MKVNKWIKAWLIIGCVMVFFQIFIGGITRLTGSGLSITKWDIVMGTFPPMSEKQWDQEFDLYKETPQFKKINRDISLSKFKFIYFWEYFHRLWARLMGFVFVIPFLIFLFRKWLDKRLIKHLAYVIFFAALAAVFGWVMVASGLNERPWVNAYNLSLHLGIALSTLGILFWTTLMVFKPGEKVSFNTSYYKHIKILFGFLLVQIFFGAILSGMRAAMFYPSWPDLNGSFIPQVLFDTSEWNVNNLINYDKNTFMPAIIHVLHRNTGYIVFIYGLYVVYDYYKVHKHGMLVNINFLLVSLLITQVLLGIFTLLYSGGGIPVLLGVFHQAVAILIFLCLLTMIYIMRCSNERKILNL